MDKQLHEWLPEQAMANGATVAVFAGHSRSESTWHSEGDRILRSHAARDGLVVAEELLAAIGEVQHKTAGS